MDVFEAMRGRQSVRRFLKDPVPREAVLRMVEAASWAPSAGNAQNVRFLVLEDRELVQRLKGIVDEIVARATGREIPPGKINAHNLFAAAPLTVCVIGTPYESATDRALREKDPERHRIRRYHVNAGLQSVAAAVMQFLLAAHALGYGTCWMTGPLVAKAELESALSIRFPEELLGLVAVGKPDSPPPKPLRKAPQALVEFR